MTNYPKALDQKNISAFIQSTIFKLLLPDFSIIFLFHHVEIAKQIG